jgi:hypothetical protein
MKLSARLAKSWVSLKYAPNPICKSAGEIPFSCIQLDMSVDCTSTPGFDSV